MNDREHSWQVELRGNRASTTAHRLTKLIVAVTKGCFVR